MTVNPAPTDGVATPVIHAPDVTSASGGSAETAATAASKVTGASNASNASTSAAVPVGAADDGAPDLERRFGGMARLYGSAAPNRLAMAHVAVIGIGGVGSWAVEALARSGVGALTLVDLDVVSESNINRQLHALTDTLGQSKVAAMAERIAGIHPACRVTQVDDFITPDNVATLLAGDYDAVLDCADQAAAKVAMILHTCARRIPIVVCGGAGGKTDPLALRGGDLSTSLNDALLSKLRTVLRRQHGYPRASDQAGRPRKRVPKMNVYALWFDQPAILPDAWSEGAGAALACAGYGSVVTVTAAMGMAAAHHALGLIVSRQRE